MSDGIQAIEDHEALQLKLKRLSRYRKYKKIITLPDKITEKDREDFLEGFHNDPQIPKHLDIDDFSIMN